MATMHAAVVTSFDEPPHYLETEVPVPHGEHEVLADVLAVGLHPRVRSGASGAHYTSSGTLPMIPGVDGVARLRNGETVYFVADDDTSGSLAERVVIDVRRSIRLPEGTDVARVAASMNPAMSSWVALRRRVQLAPGASVLVLGATGSAGTAAVQVAKRLGAGHVIGAGRDEQRLDALTGLGADQVVRLTGDAAATTRDLAAAAEVDVVLDYLWGPPAAQAIVAILTAREDRSRGLDWIEIGSVAGATAEVPSAALRSANLRLLGSGQGSVSPREYLAELPSLVEELQSGTIGVAPRTAPLSDVENMWAAPDVPGERIVFVP
ncbi:MAG TPA: zinc-binding alcohol dehydrogenase family protein [Humibacter sp.]|jgi:NADPH:quinone reductase-like Zn-dependent oxidoreductase|nr:zinc-binding alcohol dehydrogenase family protein [Humibacter sp.]